jgi:flagellar hook-associated protein 1 FlgK
MSLAQALNSSLSGLRATQAGLALVASNVANAQTPGYVRKTLVQETTSSGETGGGVRVAAVRRELDVYVMRQLRVELSGGGYTNLRADFYERLQQLFGAPGSDGSLESVFNGFANSVQALVTSPDSAATRSAVLSSAQILAQHLNSMSQEVQGLRGDAESGLADAVASANDAIAKIAAINHQLANSTGATSAEAVLQDQRDLYVSQLADLMDIRVVVGEHNDYNVFTNSGVQLVGAEPAQLVFEARGTMGPYSQWDPDPSQSDLSSLILQSSNGMTVDLTANKSIRSGRIGGIDALIALQGQDDLPERRRRAAKRGHIALDALDELKAGVLAGTVEPSTLLRLKSATANLVDASGDARLDAVLSEIELRVEVEIAKMTPRQSASN